MELTEQELKDKIAAAVTEATNGLKENRDKALGKLDALKTQLAAIEAEKEQAVQDALLKDGKHTELIDRMNAGHKTAIDDLKTQLTTAESGLKAATENLRKVLVDKELTGLFAAAGVTDENLLKAAVMLNAPLAVVTDGEDGAEPVVSINGEPLDAFMKTWTEGAGKSFITNGNTGGGAGNNSGGDTDEFEQFFKPGTVNLTKQNELKRANPERYEALNKQYAPQSTSLPLVAPQQQIVG